MVSETPEVSVKTWGADPHPRVPNLQIDLEWYLRIYISSKFLDDSIAAGIGIQL